MLESACARTKGSSVRDQSTGLMPSVFWRATRSFTPHAIRPRPGAKIRIAAQIPLSAVEKFGLRITETIAQTVAAKSTRPVSAPRSCELMPMLPSSPHSRVPLQLHTLSRCRGTLRQPLQQQTSRRVSCEMGGPSFTNPLFGPRPNTRALMNRLRNSIMPRW